MTTPWNGEGDAMVNARVLPSVRIDDGIEAFQYNVLNETRKHSLRVINVDLSNTTY